VSALLECRDVHFAYGAPQGRRGRAFCLTGVTFTIPRGEIVSVIGPNSAGKTTLIRLLTRVIKPTTGTIFLDGRPLGGLGSWELARQVAVVPQDVPAAFPFTVEQLVLMGRFPYGPHRYFESEDDRAIAHDAMAATGILSLADSPVDALSGGERQRAILARAIAQRPRLLVLDEPTAHLDLRHQVQCAMLLSRLNREQGMTVLFVSHDLDLAARLAHRLLLLVDGRLAAAGTPAEVLEVTRLEEAFGCRVAVEAGPAGGPPVVRVDWSAPPLDATSERV